MAVTLVEAINSYKLLIFLTCPDLLIACSITYSLIAFKSLNKVLVIAHKLPSTVYYWMQLTAYLFIEECVTSVAKTIH